MTEAGKDGGFSFKKFFTKSAAVGLTGTTLLTGGCGIEEAKTKESFEVPKSNNEAFVKTEDTTANIIENGQVNLHMTDKQALAGLKQQTAEIASDHLAAQMGANTSEKPTVDWQKTDEQAVEGLEQQTNEIKTDSLTAQMKSNTEENGIDLHMTDEQALNSLKQETNFIASEHLAGQMGTNTTNEQVNLTPNMKTVEQKTQQIAVDKMTP